MAHKLPPLRFGYDKHHKAYVDNLNKALEPYPHLAELAVEDLRGRSGQRSETTAEAT